MLRIRLKNYRNHWTISTNLNMLVLRNFLAKFLDFTMVDSKAVVNQARELQLIIHGILVEVMVISYSF